MPPKKPTTKTESKPIPLATPARPNLVRLSAPKLPNKAEIRRHEILSRFWPDYAHVTWSRKNEKGFATVPRTLPLICALIRSLSRGDASRVYLDLWGRVNDDGLVEVHDESEFALSSYPEGTRHQRTWREHISQLKELGFIAIRPKPSRAYGYILILHPHQVVSLIQATSPNTISARWWDLYTTRLAEIGADEQDPSDLHVFLENEVSMSVAKVADSDATS
jgi:hypothetical protein